MTDGSPPTPHPASADAEDTLDLADRRLPCGTASVDLLAQVCDGRGEQPTLHQRDCPHCERILSDYQHLWAPMTVLAAEPVRAPSSIISSALDYVRELAGDARDPILPFDDTDRTEQRPAGAPSGAAGSSLVTARVVMRCARRAAQQVDGVRIALSHVDPAQFGPEHLHVDHAELGAAREPAVGFPALDSDRDRPGVMVEITVAADYGQALHALADRVRVRVAAAVRELTGPRPVAVEVHIDDVISSR